MGIFDKFRKREATTAPTSSGPFDDTATEVAAILFSGSDDLEVVGESYRQTELWALVGGVSTERVRQKAIAFLIPDPNNQHDPNAIAVYIDRFHVGFIPRDMAARLIPGLNSLYALNPGKYVALEGVITGGGMREDGLGNLGVFLNYDPTDFGLEAPKPPSVNEPVATGLRTGLSDAMASDLDDDSYDLSWMHRLSPDPIKRMAQLREELATNADPISRHFIMAELEQMLYTYKEALPNALDEYDQVAEQHHQELQASIRAALIAKWGALPLLQTYRQAGIRQSKAGNLAGTVDWCERGIAMYGEDAFSQGWVLDLEKRSAQAQTRLDKQTAIASRKASQTKPQAAKAPPPELVENLTCVTCGKDFERIRTRGRKPTACPDCKQA